jgi:hypothetical protein
LRHSIGGFRCSHGKISDLLGNRLAGTCSCHTILGEFTGTRSSLAQIVCLESFAWATGDNGDVLDEGLA